MFGRPGLDEVEAPYRTSFDQVPEGNVVEILREQIDDTEALLGSIGEEKANHRYAPGKWSIKEVIGHLADSERVMSYRALCFARGDQTPLPGYEQDDYVVTGRFDARTLDDLLREYRAIRASTLALFEGFDEEMLRMRGTASGARFSVRALAYVVCGHEIHHKRILRERYL